MCTKGKCLQMRVLLLEWDKEVAGLKLGGIKGTPPCGQLRVGLVPSEAATCLQLGGGGSRGV
jgi:hypothetical protein